MKRSKFSLSNTKLLSCDMGELVPLGLTEVLPGDTLQQATNALIRVSPLLAPVMHPVNARIHHWYVPHRLVWEDFEDFITGGDDGFDASVFPTLTDNFAVGTLGDYLGVPTGVAGLEASALPFRGYNLIFNEWYRDQDLVTKLIIATASGADTTTETDMQNIAWEKDYFTASRPWTQKGPEVTLTLAGDAPVTGIGNKASMAWSSSATAIRETDGTGTETYADSKATNTSDFHIEEDPTNAGFPNIRADLSGVSATTINDLRLAFALQRYEEARARYGSRYTEYLRHLGVRSSDARLQRPEYLGGGKQTIQFSEVLQTAEGTQPVGELRGHGIGALRTNRYRRYFEEHGYVFSLLSVRPKTIYTQGLSRHWNRRVKEDFFQAELQSIGQQEVLNKELYAAHTTPEGVFGYSDRYDEYRRTESTVSGEFRETVLDFWHMARIFASDPTLNADFITSVPTKRINAVQTNDVLWIMANHSIQARRMLSKVARPSVY